MELAERARQTEGNAREACHGFRFTVEESELKTELNCYFLVLLLPNHQEEIGASPHVQRSRRNCLNNVAPSRVDDSLSSKDHGDTPLSELWIAAHE